MSDRLQFESRLIQPGSEISIRATVVADAATRVLEVHTVEGNYSYPLDSVACIEPISRKTGSLLLDQGREIPIPDRNAQRVFKNMRYGTSIWRHIDDIRDAWPWLIVASILLTAGIISILVWGIPSLSRITADRIPPVFSDYLGKQALDQMRSSHLADSEIDPFVRIKIDQAFESMLRANQLDPLDFSLHFHASDSMGANAFALPSGDLVLLDGLWDIGMLEPEILGILAHEVAHVQHRHGLQMLLRYAGVTTLIAITLGDLQSASLLRAVPTLLLEKGYSRSFEREADITAVAILERAGYPAHVLADALQRLGELPESAAVPILLSSHPNIEERITLIRETAQRLDLP
ncbi:MAG: M48 family metallopeptidase [Puniceicoccaceae bacterium]